MAIGTSSASDLDGVDEGQTVPLRDLMKVKKSLGGKLETAEKQLAALAGEVETLRAQEVERQAEARYGGLTDEDRLKTLRAEIIRRDTELRKREKAVTALEQSQAVSTFDALKAKIVAEHGVTMEDLEDAKDEKDLKIIALEKGKGNASPRSSEQPRVDLGVRTGGIAPKKNTPLSDIMIGLQRKEYIHKE